jgi:predicted RNase H-like nuclease (RuvC/YqgF family)
MAKIIVKQVVDAVTDTVLRQLMPRLNETIESLHADIRPIKRELSALDAKVDNLREDMLDRFERQLNTINEVSHRITRVEGKLEGYMEGLRTVIGPLKVLPKRKAS